ncbi:MAG: hypothetical protein GEV07_13065 [Streptosporangiales bacterium]|nr:hypothetical protein [Streptosporangiales bacterium]
MNATLSTILTFAPLAGALFALVMAIANKPMGMPHLVVLGILELGLLVQLVVSIVVLVQGERPADGMLTFLLYLIGSLLVLPIGAAWGFMDRSRWSSVVVAVACLVLPVLIVRMNQVWAGA